MNSEDNVREDNNVESGLYKIVRVWMVVDFVHYKEPIVIEDFILLTTFSRVETVFNGEWMYVEKCL
jgi:hypothetical protein